jgi:hypothetical protein
MATTGLPHWPWQHAEADALPPAERLVIDAARAWAAAARNARPRQTALREVLMTEGAEEATGALEALLQVLAQRPLTLGCLLCPRLVGEEPALLLALACAQRSRRHETLALLLRRLPPRDAYVATAAAIAIGAGLRAAGLRLAEPWGAGQGATRTG